MNRLKAISAAVFFAAIFWNGTQQTCDGQIQKIDASAGQAKDAQTVLNDFATSWDDKAWEKEFRTSAEKYMRATGDRGWHLRMAAIQQLVALGDEGIPALVKALQSENPPTRILSAQTLGFLGDKVPLEPILDAIRNDESPAVRLYAVDSYGMLGGNLRDLNDLLAAEKNRDVKLHIKYAVEREGSKLDPAVAESLKHWDAKTMDSARVDELAPDFALSTVEGEKIRLSDYRDKSNVILVFIYGDT